MRAIKLIVEKHPDGYVAYPLGLKGVVVGEGDSYEEVLADVRSAIRFHIESFGPEVLEEGESPILEVFVAEAGVPRARQYGSTACAGGKPPRYNFR